MNRRLFLPALILSMILLDRFLGTDLILDAPPPHPPWMLTLPNAMFNGIALIAACGIGAQFWLGLLPLCGANWVPYSRMEHLGNTCLWCSWPLLLPFCSLPPGYMPLLTHPRMTLWMGVPLSLQLSIGVLLLIICRLLNKYGKKDIGYLTTVLTAAVALSCGDLWWQGEALHFLTLSLCLPLPLLLWEQREERPMALLLLTALGLCLYSQFFQELLTHYLPGSPLPACPLLLFVLVAILLLLITKKPSRLFLAGIILLLLILSAQTAFHLKASLSPLISPEGAAFLAALALSLALCWLHQTSPSSR